MEVVETVSSVVRYRYDDGSVSNDNNSANEQRPFPVAFADSNQTSPHVEPAQSWPHERNEVRISVFHEFVSSVDKVKFIPHGI